MVYFVMALLLFAGLFVVSFYFAIKSLGMLGYKFSSYYSFGKLIPNAGSWAFWVYALALLVILILFVLIARFGLKVYPA